MEQKRELRCLIAAGGTAGHVAPSLAVAEALQRRGVHVTFAGSPDRVEAQLVPEAGYELDTFRIAGLPRSLRRRSRERFCSPDARRVRAHGSSPSGSPMSCSAAEATSRARWCTQR